MICVGLTLQWPYNAYIHSYSKKSLQPETLLLCYCYLFSLCTIKERCLSGCFSSSSALPLLGFSPKILGFRKQSWVLGFSFEGLGFFLGFSKVPWVFLGFFQICPKIYLFLLFFAESQTF